MEETPIESPDFQWFCNLFSLKDSARSLQLSLVLTSQIRRARGPLCEMELVCIGLFRGRIFSIQITNQLLVNGFMAIGSNKSGENFCLHPIFSNQLLNCLAAQILSPQN